MIGLHEKGASRESCVDFGRVIYAENISDVDQPNLIWWCYSWNLFKLNFVFKHLESGQWVIVNLIQPDRWLQPSPSLLNVI